MSNLQEDLFGHAIPKAKKTETHIGIKKAKQIAIGKTITLCGPTIYKYEYARVNMLLTLAGNLVISCGVFRDDFKDIEEYRFLLESIHRHKISISDMIFVINVNNFVGKHTREEIAYAESINKEVVYLFDEKGNKVL